MARLATRLTERFGIEHPILSAPMALAAGGALAAAVTRAGGLGLIGGGYGDGDWLRTQYAAASSPGLWQSSRICSARCWPIARRR